VTGDNFHAGLAIVVVAEADACSRLRLHDDLVAVLDELIGGRREERHAMLLGFDFLRDSDDHAENMNPKLFFRKRFLA
jgi:hypothetical protein